MSFISNYLIIALCITVLYCIGLLSFITNYDENQCEITYMFEYPQFTKINLKAYSEYPQYGLYAYSEGKQTENVRSMKFSGIPVLFVPGNKGSYKQVRSLASVALRKALSSHTNFHFDFYTVHLNNELSGLNGAVLAQQTSFLNHSLHRVLELYDKSKGKKPSSVIVIAHSMGGVIAHGLMMNPLYTNNIELLITLATPHRRPTVYLDSYAAQYYQQIQMNHLFNNWQNKTFISVAGGNNDHLVNSHLTHSNFSSLNVVSTGIPKVWLTMDHACIMWCKQFVITIIKALFDCVDLQSRQLSDDHNYRLSVFNHHLIKNSGTFIRSSLKYQSVHKFFEHSEWREDLRRQYSIRLRNGSRSIQFHMVRFLNDPKHQSLYVQALNLESNWIFACSASYIQGNSRICVDGYHLSHESEIIPSVRHKRKTYHVDLFQLKKRYPEISHVIVQVMPTPKPVTIDFDIHNPRDRTFSFVLPRWFSLTKTPILKQTDSGALHYQIELMGLQHVVQSYSLYIEPVKCKSYHVVAKLQIPWANQDVNTVFTEINKNPMKLNLYSSRPTSNNSTAKLFLTLDSSCQFTISIQNSLIGMFTQFARIYSPFLIVNMAAVILMTLRSQLNCIEQTGKCPTFQSTLSMSTKPYYLITSAKLLSRVLTYNKFSEYIALPDVQILLDENLDFLILPLLLYVIAAGLVYILSLILWGFLILSENTVHRFVARFLTRTIGGAVKWSDWLITSLHRIPCVVALTLIALGLVTCTQLSLCLGVLFYFLKLTQMCQEYVEGLIYIYLQKLRFRFSGLFKKRKNKNSEDRNGANGMSKNENEAENKHDNSVSENVKETGNENADILEVVNTNIRLRSNKNINENSKSKNGAKSINEGDIKNKSHTEQINETKPKQLKQSDATNSKSNTEDSTLAISNNRANQQNPSVSQNEFSIETSIHLHFTMFLLWVMIAILNIPVLFTWAHIFPNNNNDVFVPGLILCISAIPLWQTEIPNTNKLYYKHLSSFIYVMAVLCLLYAPIHLYKLTYILTAVLSIITIHQLFAPNKPISEQTSNSDINNETQDFISSINDIKTKLE